MPSETTEVTKETTKTETSPVNKVVEQVLAGLNLLDLDIAPKDIVNGSMYSKEYDGVRKFFWEGTGSFDIFIRALDENIRTQHSNGRIQGPEYATAYVRVLELALNKGLELVSLNEEMKLKALQAKLQAAMQAAEISFKEKELKFKEKELDLRLKQLEAELQLTGLKQENLREQTKVYARQVEGFSDNLKLKLFQAQMEAFSMIYSAGMLDFDANDSQFPKALKASNLTDVYNKLFESATANWEYDIGTGKSKYSVENRIRKGGEESGIKL